MGCIDKTRGRCGTLFQMGTCASQEHTRLCLYKLVTVPFFGSFKFIFIYSFYFLIILKIILQIISKIILNNILKIILQIIFKIILKIIWGFIKILERGLTGITNFTVASVATINVNTSLPFAQS